MLINRSNLAKVITPTSDDTREARGDVGVHGNSHGTVPCTGAGVMGFDRDTAGREVHERHCLCNTRGRWRLELHHLTSQTMAHNHTHSILHVRVAVPGSIFERNPDLFGTVGWVRLSEHMVARSISVHTYTHMKQENSYLAGPEEHSESYGSGK